MSKKPKFKPQIVRVKLNPEQAVLYCACHWTETAVNPSAQFGGSVCRNDDYWGRSVYTASCITYQAGAASS